MTLVTFDELQSNGRRTVVE